MFICNKKMLFVKTLFFLTAINAATSYAMDNDKDGVNFHTKSFSAQDGFISKDEKYFDFSKEHPYVSKDAFDKIFKMTTPENFNPLTAKLEISSRREKKEESFVSGSGSIIDIDKDGIFKAVTNAHVMYDKYKNINLPIEEIDFSKISPEDVRYGTLKQAMLSETQYIKGKIHSVCFSNKKRDLAMVFGKYTEKHSKNIPYDSIKQRISFEDCVGEKATIFFGHPVGVNEQRVREGKAYCEEGKHNMSSLFGDSGGGLYSDRGKYIGTHVGGDRDSLIRKDIMLEGKKQPLPEYRVNKFIPVSKSDLDSEFTHCYNKHDI
jgi:hypothetical protein